MPDASTPPDNFDRLRKHLKDGSLAARLVEAHRKPGAATPTEAAALVLRARLEQVRGSFDKTEA